MMHGTASHVRPRTRDLKVYAVVGLLGLATFVRLLLAPALPDTPGVEVRIAAPIGHLVGSAVVAATAALAAAAAGWSSRRTLVAVAVGAVLFSVATEVGQMFVAGRTATVLDGVVNVTGAMLGAGAVLVALSRPGIDRLVGPAVVVVVLAWSIAGNVALGIGPTGSQD
jgi:VanZ family protein